MKLQCFRVRLPDGREGEFWGQELVPDGELSRVRAEVIKIFLCRAVEVQEVALMETPGIHSGFDRTGDLTEYVMLNRNRKN